MPVDLAGRARETRAISEFLDAVGTVSTALVLDGEPGIGKTTVWLEGIERAVARGARVLTARPGAAESRLAYAALADLLDGVEPAVLAALPVPQRTALDQVLLRAGAHTALSDPRAVGAALLSVVEALAAESPVVVAIDDLQWLDASTVGALMFAARRWSAGVGVLAVTRSEHAQDPAARWLEVARPDAVRRVHVGPLSLGAVHAMIIQRLGRSFPRPTMVRIQEVSGGNPLYALELAHATADGRHAPDGRLPPTLAELVEERIGAVDARVRDVLLVAAAAAEPTVELVQRAAELDDDTARELLEQAERHGVVEIEGHRLRFGHPLLAAGVYGGADRGRRRAVHRRLAAVVEEPELRARHLALAAVRADPETVRALDEGAARARARGAPAAAAELLTLALALGADGPQRRIELAEHQLAAGDLGAARGQLDRIVGELPAGPLRAAALCLWGVVRLHDDSYRGAVELLTQALAEVGPAVALRVRILLQLSYALLNAGDLDGAVLRGDEAVAVAGPLGDPMLLSQALALRVLEGFLRGDGCDEESLERALELEDPQAPVPVVLRAGVARTMLLAWTAQLPEARERLLRLHRACLERGEEHELVFVTFHSALVETWRGDLAGTALLADEALERAAQLGGDVPHAVALTLRAVVAAHAGREADARRDAEEALATYRRCGWHTLAELPVGTLGFLELSLGNHSAALAVLRPLVAQVVAAPRAVELVMAPFVPDAVEALVHLGRLAEAEELVDILEVAGHRLDRAWTIAVAARSRGVLLAARGDLAGAREAVHRALAAVEPLGMPFERARTQLLLGQLLRRARHRDPAVTTLTAALAAFEELGTPLWAERARAELARIGASGRSGLTAAEWRVAELAATGMTNREVAAALFISPKTVEANLARIYRKLGIRSRAELGQRVG